MDGLDTQFNDVLKSVGGQPRGDYASILSGLAGQGAAPGTLDDSLANVGRVRSMYQTPGAPPSSAPQQAAIRQQMGQEQKIISGMENMPPPPAPTAAVQLPEAPPERYTDEFNAFRGFAPVMAIFASLKTRHPLTTAMGAMASSMDAYHKGEKDKFELERENYKENLDKAIKQQQMDMDVYKAIINARHTSVEEKMAQLTAHAHLISDEQTLAGLQGGDYDGVTKRIDKQNEITEHALNFVSKFNKNAASGGALPADDPGIKFRIGLAATGDPAAFQNISRGKAGDAIRNSIWSGLAAEPGMTPEKLASLHLKFKSLTSEEGALGTQTAKLATAGEEFDRMADLAEAASDKVDRGEYPTLNKAVEAYDAGTGDVNVVSLVTNARGAVNTWARAINPNGVATVEATTAGTHLLNVAYSKGQFSEALKQMRNETKAARAAPVAVQKSIGDQVTGNPASAPASSDGWSITPVGE